MIKHSPLLLLFVCVFFMVVRDSRQTDIALYLGHINSKHFEMKLHHKYRLLNEKSIPEGSEHWNDLSNALSGNFTALRDLVRDQLDVEPYNLFYRGFGWLQMPFCLIWQRELFNFSENNFIEMQSDEELKAALEGEENHLLVYACFSGMGPCY